MTRHVYISKLFWRKCFNRVAIVVRVKFFLTIVTSTYLFDRCLIIATKLVVLDHILFSVLAKVEEACIISLALWHDITKVVKLFGQFVLDELY